MRACHHRGGEQEGEEEEVLTQLQASDQADTEVKIADFGLSKIVNQKVMMQTACGTPG